MNQEPRCRCGKVLPKPGPKGGRQKRTCEACQFALDHDIYFHHDRTCVVCGAVFRLGTGRYRTAVRADCCSVPCTRRAWYLETMADPKRKAQLRTRTYAAKRAQDRRRQAGKAPCLQCGATLGPRHRRFCSKQCRVTFWINDPARQERQKAQRIARATR